MQSRKTNIYIYIMGRKESKKKIERIGRMKRREKENFFLLLEMDSVRDGKPFYRLS